MSERPLTAAEATLMFDLKDDARNLRGRERTEKRTAMDSWRIIYGQASEGERAHIIRKRNGEPILVESTPFRAGAPCYRLERTLERRDGRFMTDETTFRHAEHAYRWARLTMDTDA